MDEISTLEESIMNLSEMTPSKKLLLASHLLLAVATAISAFAAVVGAFEIGKPVPYPNGTPSVTGPIMFTRVDDYFL
jgi:hypothetical protein